ncbi:hypothetical protein C8Q74DRAFT_1252648 [Fomes fomentarius]|nr:hypothetical protein C8Q74DRAFT_1252648 [Fomes fomentarius]
MPLDRSLSIFPTLPRTSVAGMALVQVGKDRIQEISELMDPVYPVPDKLVPLPKGSIEADGYLVASVKSVPVWQVQSTPPSNASHALRALDGTFWQLSPPNEECSRKPKVFAALLGWFHWYYPRWVISEDDTENIRLMLLETRPGRKAEDGDDEGRAALTVYVRSFICLNQSEKEVVLQWTARQFCIGASDTHGLNMSEPTAGMSGSGTGNSVPKPSIAEVQQTYFEEAPPWPAGSSGNEYVNECRGQAQAAQPYKTVQELFAKPNIDGTNSPLRYV